MRQIGYWKETSRCRGMGLCILKGDYPVGHFAIKRREEIGERREERGERREEWLKRMKDDEERRGEERAFLEREKRK